MIVTLTDSNLITAGHVGVRRWSYLLAHGCRSTYGGGLDPHEPGAIDQHIRAAMSEFAVAKAFNLFWDDNIGKFKAIDVGGLIEVRYVDSNNKRLIVHPPDKDWLPFVSVLIDLPHFILRGWMLGRDAKQKEWWLDPVGGRPAFFVPNAKLLPIDQLRVDELRATAPPLQPASSGDTIAEGKQIAFRYSITGGKP